MSGCFGPYEYVSRLTRLSMKFKMADPLPPVTTPPSAAMNAMPVAAIPMQYRTNIALLAMLMALTPSSIAVGHFRSDKLMPGLNSLSIMAVGSKWNRDVRLEHRVTFFLG